MLGEAIACRVRWRSHVGDPLGSPRFALPEGFRRTFGPVLVVATRYYASPVGPFMTLVIAEPTRLAGRSAHTATLVVTDTLAAQVGMRLNWGIPAELAPLSWFDRGGELELVWADRGFSMTGEPRRLIVPIISSMRGLQMRSDDPVLVPGSIRGIARLARVTITTAEGDQLAALSGKHRGVVMNGAKYVAQPAVTPAGWMAAVPVSQGATGRALGFHDATQRSPVD
jgi:hypothetical protein